MNSASIVGMAVTAVVLNLIGWGVLVVPGNHGPGRHLSAPAAVVHSVIGADSGGFSPGARIGPIPL
ncbi:MULTISPECIES: hypothetical protein [unclassified Rhodococcus (in: high G+C Gram-positive bacteria)]|uniref:hypothetical protein n=1 Tax=unclassified Rhodococcus (in: high G+C Gram-positive bacteria) TaxID=192944 RepID=UPI0002FB5F53|nr:hypothetical protein [Rhodococcus sp. DK17]